MIDLLIVEIMVLAHPNRTMLLPIEVTSSKIYAQDQ
jgi:hypothetical protein